MRDDAGDDHVFVGEIGSGGLRLPNALVRLSDKSRGRQKADPTTDTLRLVSVEILRASSSDAFRMTALPPPAVLVVEFRKRLLGGGPVGAVGEEAVDEADVVADKNSKTQTEDARA